MSLTVYDIKKACFTNDLNEVQELTLTNKGLTDVGSVGEVLNLQSLNLAFNSLSSLTGLSVLQHLQTLNVSHNQLASVKALSSLTSLTSLNASHNKISSIAPLEELTNLRDLCLQSNQLKNVSELQCMSALSGLTKLWLTPNPVCKQLLDKFRSVAIHLSPQLQFLDATPCTAEERDAASKMEVGDLLQPPAAALPPLSTLPTLDSYVIRTGRSSSRTSGHSDTLGGLPSVPERRRARSQVRLTKAPETLQKRASGGLLDSGVTRVRSASPSAAGPPQWEGGSEAAGGPCGEDDDAHSIISALSSTAVSSVMSTRSTASRRRAELAAPLRPALPKEGSNFLVVLDKLPKFEASKLPSKYSVSQANEGVVKKAVTPPKPPPESQAVSFECKYARGHGRAVTVRADGSVAAYWPNGDIAVTVDLDYSAAAPSPCVASRSSSPRGEGGEAGPSGEPPAKSPQPLYRMFAAFRLNGNVAVSFDSASGGFIQYPSGAIAIICSPTSGTMYSSSGEVLQKWDSSDSKPGSSPPPQYADLMLDSHLGIRYQPSSNSLQLYMSCEGLRYWFVCGRNSPGASWEPGGGGGRTGRSEPASHLELEDDPGGQSGALQLDRDASAPPFLPALAKEGSAAAARATMRPSQATQPPPEPTIDISAIANALRALDEGLTQWALGKAKE